jgi:hypothetical protein
MDQRGRRDQRVAFGSGVGNVESRAPLRHGRIDSQDTTFESSENLMVDPGAQHSTLCRVLARDQQRAKFDFENRDSGHEEARCGERVRPSGDTAIGFVRSSQLVHARDCPSCARVD